MVADAASTNVIARWSRAIARLYSAPLLSLLLLGTAGFLWVFNYSWFPFSNPELLKLSGGEGLLDLLPFYTAEKAFEALGHYGVAGRELYARFLVADFIFIPFYSFALALLLTRALRALWGEDTPRLVLNLLPFGIAIFDVIEDSCIAAMLRIYPTTSVALGTVSGIATLGKTLLTIATMLLLAGAGTVLLLRRLRGERAPGRAN